MKKKLFMCIAVFVLLSFGFTKGTKEKKSETTYFEGPVRVGALVGPSGVGMAYLFENSLTINGMSYEYETYASVDILLPKLINGDLDIGILPPNVAVKLYNSDPNSIVALATVGNGMLSLISKDTSINTLKDLEGKSITVAGQGSTPEYVLRTLLQQEKIESVDLDFSIPNSEIAAAIISGKIEYALVPEPFATVAVLNSKSSEKPVFKVLNIKQIWQEHNDSKDFPMTLCVSRSNFARSNPLIIESFLNEYKLAIEWTVSTPNEAGVFVEKAGLGLKAPIASQAIPSSNYVFARITEQRKELEDLLSVFLNYAPIAIGGKYPDENFYYK